jgi:hypothetical protein
VDAISPAMLAGAEFLTLWGADRLPNFPDDGSQHACPSYFPHLGGFRFMMFTVPPQSASGEVAGDRQALLTDFKTKLPGLAQHMERTNPGMHTSDTIDFEYIISGEIWLELDDGVVVHLRAGDTVVQNGTRHAWRNRANEPCHTVQRLMGHGHISSTLRYFHLARKHLANTPSPLDLLERPGTKPK